MDFLSSWIEIPVDDMARAKAFYQKFLNVELTEMTMGPIVYAFFPAKDRKNTGALIKSPYVKPSDNGTRMYFETGESVDRILAKIVEAGGSVVMPRLFVSDEGGFIGLFRDTEGNVLGVHETLSR